MGGTGRAFVRQCCWVYLAVFLGSWLLAFGLVSLKAWKIHRSPVELLFFQNAAQSFSDLTEFDPATRRAKPVMVITPEWRRKAETYITYDTFQLPGLYYPAAGMSLYLIFMAFAEPVRAFLLITSVLAAAAAGVLLLLLRGSRENRVLLAGSVLLSLVLGYPLLFLIERGNVEIVVWAVQAAALSAFLMRRYWAAALLLGAAAAMKIYPAVFLLLLLHKKRYWEIGGTAAAAAAANLMGLWLLGPTIPKANADVRSGLQWVNEQMLTNYRDGYVGAYDHSMFEAVKQGLHFSDLHHPEAVGMRIQRAALPYLALMGAGLAALYWFRVRRLPLLNQVAFLTIVEVTLPYMSQEYTLVHLYLPWAIFLLFLARDVAVGRAGLSLAAAGTAMAAFGFLFAPTPHQYLNHSFVGQMQLCALVALAAVFAADSMPSSLFGEIPAA